MTEALNRDDIVGLLQSLGSDQDEEVLAAARALHARVTAAGTAWDDLLVADEAGDTTDTTDTTDTADDAEADESAVAETPAETAGNNAETLALIDKLLAKPGISEDFREELKGYKTDISEGEFEAADHRYVHALYNRLMPQGRK